MRLLVLGFIMIPVTLPVGRASFVVKPSATGSASTATTIGITVVAFAAATASTSPSPDGARRGLRGRRSARWG
jgi:hypothetical protein